MVTALSIYHIGGRRAGQARSLRRISGLAMCHQAAADASFYALLHYVQQSSQRATPLEERRSNERHEFTSLQFVAPYYDSRLPCEAEFECVVCKDLSPNGVSYLTAKPPASEFVIVALGGKPPIFVSGAVVRLSPLPLAGEELTLVAVRFITRIHIPDIGPLAADPPPYAAALLREF